MKNTNKKLVELRFYLEDSFSSEQLSQFAITPILNKVKELFGECA